ncbi:MAG TPA: DUF2752 domain-containing protein [Candidatus Limnocylindria bacterium]
MPRRDRQGHLASAEGLLAAAIACAALVPSAFAERGPNLCLISRLIGRSCPACGMTRSWVAMAHGDFARSLKWHPLGPVAYVLATILVLRHFAPRPRASDA